MESRYGCIRCLRNARASDAWRKTLAAGSRVLSRHVSSGMGLRCKYKVTQRIFWKAIICAFVASTYLAWTDVSAEPDKKRVSIISKLSDRNLDAFYSLLKRENANVDSFHGMTEWSEPDVIVYFFGTWAEARGAPGEEVFPMPFEFIQQVDGLDQPPAYINAFYLQDNGRMQNIVFYSIKDSNFPSDRCLVEHVAVEVDRQPGDHSGDAGLLDCMER